MDALTGLVTGFGVILTPQNLYFCFLGSLIGTLVGVLPGVGPLAALGSFIAGTLSVVAMTFFAPALAAIAIRFGPPENFGLMVLGLVCTLYMITGSAVKGVLMIALGFLAAAIGIDVVNGQERFTFGSIELTAGIELLAVVIGLFGVAEILANVEQLTQGTLVTERTRG